MSAQHYFGLLSFLLLIRAPLNAEVPAEHKATVEYLRSLQTAEGSYLPEPQPANVDARPRGTLRATSAAVRALKYFGAEVPNPERTAKFVEACFDAQLGGFADRPIAEGAKPNVFTTAVGLMAAKALGLPAQQFRAAAVKYLSENCQTFEDIRIAVAGLEALAGAVKELDDAVLQQWRTQVKPQATDARTLGSCWGAQLRLGVAVEELSGGPMRIKLLQAGQRPDGGFGAAHAPTSDLETTYRVMRAFFMLQAQPKDPAKLREFLAKCRSANGAYAVEPGKPANVAATYYAAAIYHFLGDARRSSAK